MSVLLFAAVCLGLAGAPGRAGAEPVDLRPYDGPPLPALSLPLLPLTGPLTGETRLVPERAPDAAPGPLLVHFFATWCEPCRAELPALSRLAARQPDLRVVLIDVAEPEARVRRFFEAISPPGPILMDQDRAASRAFGVEVLPSTLVFAGGQPRLAARGEVDWDDPAVEAQLAALASGAAGRKGS